MEKLKMKRPEWLKKAIRNRKERERYFIKKYNSLEKMHAIDGKAQDWMDNDSLEDEMERCK